MEKEQKNMEESIQEREIRTFQSAKNGAYMTDSFASGYDFLTNSAATMDCTGLEYKTAKSDEEREHYEQVYNYQPCSKKCGQDNL